MCQLLLHSLKPVGHMAAEGFDSDKHIKVAMKHMGSITKSLDSDQGIDPSDIENLKQSLYQFMDNGICPELCEKAVDLLDAMLKENTSSKQKRQSQRENVRALEMKMTQVKKDMEEKQEELDMMIVCQVAFSIEDMVIEQVLPMNETLRYKDKITRIYKMEEVLNGKKKFKGIHTEEERQEAHTRWIDLQGKIGWTSTSNMYDAFHKIKRYRLGIAHKKEPPKVVNRVFKKQKEKNKIQPEDEWYFTTSLEVYENLWSKNQQCSKKET